MDRLFSYLNSLDDDYYFFVANTLLGKVGTPFHKPVVNNAIRSFLLNGENRQSILGSLGADDRKVISFMQLAKHAKAQQVAAFFSSESYPIVHTHLENLRDRLILLREDGEYFLNPILDDVLLKAYDPDLALGENKGYSSPTGHVDRNVLFSVLNLLSNGSVPPREANAHHFAKSDRLNKVFPQFSKASSLAFFSALKALLINEGVAKPAEGRFSIDPDRARNVLELDDLNLLIAATGTGCGAAIQNLLGILRAHSLKVDQSNCLLSLFAEDQKPETILDHMESFGFIRIGDGIVRLNPSVLENPADRSALGVDSDLDVSYFGLAPSDDILYLFADVEVCDNLVRYKITKDSFIRALNLGLDAERISSFLGTHDHDGLFALWADSFGRISLYDGIVIRCDPQVSAIVPSHPKISPHIIAKLNETTFVMDRSDEWRGALSYAMDLKDLPLPKGERTSFPHNSGSLCNGFSIPQPPVQSSMDFREDGESLRAQLLDDAKAKGCLTDEVRALIDAKLIVSKSQIGKAFRYASMQTIGGFDYSAKLSAIRNILKAKEIPLLSIELSDSTILVQPIELMKGEGILKVKVLPQGLEKSIPVSSIFKATVMRWSMANR